MSNKKSVKSFSSRNIILVMIFVVIAGGLVLVPKFDKNDVIQPEKLLVDAISPERYISTDELADRLINQDPSLLLIDLRTEEEHNKYSLANTVNIPIENIFSEENQKFIDQDKYDVVFYSNDNFIADQAWILCKRLNYNNLYVLKGGVNEWFNTIINPKYPEQNMPTTAFELYDFRKAASMYFGVAYPEKVVEPEKPQIVPKKVIPVKKKKKIPDEGGC